MTGEMLASVSGPAPPAGCRPALWGGRYETYSYIKSNPAAVCQLSNRLFIKTNQRFVERQHLTYGLKFQVVEQFIS